MAPSELPIVRSEGCFLGVMGLVGVPTITPSELRTSGSENRVAKTFLTFFDTTTI